MNAVNYLVVIEKGPKSFGAYVPDLPGLGVVGKTMPQVKRLVRKAIKLHIAGLREDGLPIPPPTARSLQVRAPRLAGQSRARNASRQRRAAI